MKTLFTYLVVSRLTGSPLLALLVVALVWYGGASWILGRLPDPSAPFRRWSRVRRLRDEMGMNPHNVDVRTELAGLVVDRSPAEAKEMLGEVLRRCPDLPLPAYFMGLAHLGLGATDEGRAEIERALAMKRDLRYGEPMVRLGDHLYAKGDARGALAAYERATEVHGSHAEALFKAGRAARATGDAAGARRHWEETLAATRHAPGFKKRQDRVWRLRAWVALR